MLLSDIRDFAESIINGSGGMVTQLPLLISCTKPKPFVWQMTARKEPERKDTVKYTTFGSISMVRQINLTVEAKPYLHRNETVTMTPTELQRLLRLVDGFRQELLCTIMTGTHLHSSSVQIKPITTNYMLAKDVWS